MFDSVPSNCDILVIGGGPAGSTVAAKLAQDGFHVVVLEKARHPRNQVGESLIPHFWKFADASGVSKKIQREGFIDKAGGITVWDGRIHQFSFSRFGYDRPAMHVERDVFDKLLLDHARDCGAQVFERISVQRVNFVDGEDPGAIYVDKREGYLAEGRIGCKIVVDASGASSLLAGQFKSRKLISSRLRFLALWGYYQGARYFSADGCSYDPSSLPDVKPVTFVLSHCDGWAWHIILREKTSVGLVIHTDRLKGMDKFQRESFFRQNCATMRYLGALLEPADFIEGSLNFRPDYSYYSTNICGENYYCIGDAGAFVDPIFSHGVQNAFYNALVVATAIKASLQDRRRGARLSKLCESRLQQYYGFSRSLALGDCGGDGVNPELVKNLMRQMSPLELEMMLVASDISNRSGNFRQMAKDAGVLGQFDQSFVSDKATILESLVV